MSTAEHDVETLRTELEEAIAERNRLWDELQRHRAAEAELDYYRGLYEAQVSSLSWRLTLPLRALARLTRDPVGTLKIIVRRIRGTGA